MDPLSDLLRVVRLDGAYFFSVEARDPWGIQAAAADALTPRILPAAEHLISYHIVTAGKCYGGLVGEEPVELGPGDVIVFPHGDAHTMASGSDPRGVLQMDDASPRFPAIVEIGGTGGPGASLVCGFLGCDRRPFNPLLEALPRRLHVRGLTGAGLGAFAAQVAEESRRGKAGADGVLTRLAELMFVDVLRRFLDELPADRPGWLAGLRDEVVGRALALLHSRPARAWTLEELAAEAGASRSNLAARFTALVGQSPMEYLMQWRMQVAANLLAQSGAKLSVVAEEVGYGSEAAFSRAFKKATGLSPGAWRESRARGIRAASLSDDGS